MHKSPKAVIFGFSGTKLTGEEKKFFSAHNPLGFILFARNCGDKKQLRTLTKELREIVNHDNLFLLIDQEGGRVARLKPPHWHKSPPAGLFAGIAEQNIEKAREAVYLNYRIIAEELHDMGINVNCAPMLDIRFPDSHNIIGDRSLGSTSEQVIELGHKACKALIDGGVLPVIKHIPGHGRARVDSHEELPVVDATLQELAKTDFKPFQALSETPLAMTAHIKYTKIDDLEPATLSKKVIKIIRNNIGFRGLLMTDDLSMKALSGSLSELTQKSLDAGCDIILHCNGKMEEMEEIAEKAPIVAPELQKKIKTAFEPISHRNEKYDVVEAEIRLQKMITA